MLAPAQGKEVEMSVPVKKMAHPRVFSRALMSNTRRNFTVGRNYVPTICSTREPKLRDDTVVSTSSRMSVDEEKIQNDHPELVMNVVESKYSTIPPGDFVRSYNADEAAVLFPLASNTWIWSEAPNSIYVENGGGCYVQAAAEDCAWCMVPFAKTNLVTSVASYDAPSEPYGKALVSASATLSNLTQYTSGAYVGNQYFRMRGNGNSLPWSTTYTGVAGGSLIGNGPTVYYTAVGRSLGIGRGLLYYLSNTTSFVNDIPSAYFWVNELDCNDWIALSDTSSAQLPINGFRIVNPADIFWSAFASNSYVRWSNFMDSCNPLDTFKVAYNPDGILALSGQNYQGAAPYYFMDTGVQPGHDISLNTTASCIWMFQKWLSSVYNGPTLGVDKYISYDEGYQIITFYLAEIVASNHLVASQLNGNNGEWTNGDDMPPKKMKQSKNGNDKKNKNQTNSQRQGKKNKTPVLQLGLVRAAHSQVKPRVPRGLPLTNCCRNFLNACVHPFGATGKDVFLPIGYSAPTYRVRGFMRIMVSIGTGGVGFIGLVPGVSNDYNCVWYTTNSYTGTTFTPYNDAATPVLSTGVVAAPMSGLPFASSVIIPAQAGESYNTSALNCTCVAWGMEVLNASTEVNLGGTITAYSDVNRGSLWGASQAQLASFMDAQVVLGTRERVGLSVYPVEEEEIEFSPEIRARENAGAAPAALYPMNWNFGTTACTNAAFPAISNVIMFTGVPGSQYLVNIVGYNEYAGVPTQLVNKAKIVDPQGYYKVLDVLSRARSMCQEQGMRLIDAVGRAERVVGNLLRES